MYSKCFLVYFIFFFVFFFFFFCKSQLATYTLWTLYSNYTQHQTVSERKREKWNQKEKNLCESSTWFWYLLLHFIWFDCNSFIIFFLFLFFFFFFFFFYYFWVFALHGWQMFCSLHSQFRIFCFLSSSFPFIFFFILFSLYFFFFGGGSASENLGRSCEV